GNIRVYCRVRPAFNAETKNVIDFVGRDGSLVILDPLKPQKEGRKIFQFNRVFGPTATQDDVFRDTQPLIRSVMDGYNVCIFAYGQTGTGKTYTMSGPSSGSTKDTGINYLALNYLFQTSHRRKDIISYDIRVQMIEIYNEQVRDLLAEDSIRSCTNENGLSLPDATMHSVKSSTDVLNLMKLGEVNRVVSCTALNDRSSRSHSVLTVHVHGKDTYGSTLRSCLHLVDLAGSERVDKSEVTGERLREAQYINKSLSCLGDVITALAQKNSHIPYRNSKLTLLLQDSLGGNAKTLMFAHVSPEGDSFGETYSTLKFAQRVSTVELGSARLNKESSEVIQLKEQIESLKKAIATKEEQSVLHNKLKQPRLCDRPKAMTDLTPPRARRLSIENGGTMKSEKAMHTDDRKELKTSSVPTRSRRLSLEGQKGQYQDAEAVSKMDGSFRNSSSMMEVHFPRVPRSPTSSSFQKRAIKIDNRTQIPSLQLPKTPEPQISATNELHIVMQSELTVATDSQITNGKGSHIRKSLRTIGKLINGSEKRNQQASKEARSPIRVATSNNTSNLKSPVTANARALRRQSLTGIQTLGSDRRTSLGGKLFDSSKYILANASTFCWMVNDNRNAKTPPPVRSSIKTKQR
ncbi:Kinesin domain-containing protein, partial [Cephalotus follicularis]